MANENVTMTQAEALAAAIDALDAVDGMEDVVENLRKQHANKTKPRTNNGPSKATLENRELAKTAANIMPDDQPVTATWISESVPMVRTHQKATKVMEEAIKLGLVERIESDKASAPVSYMRIPQADE